MRISQINRESRAVRYLRENGGAIVHRYKCSHAKARSVFRRMASDGKLTVEARGDIFLYKVALCD